MILQREGKGIGVRPVHRASRVDGPTGDHRVVLHQHSIEEHRHSRRDRDFAVLVEVRAMKHDVVGLPLPRGSGRIHERGRLAIHRPRHAVGVGDVLVNVEHLNLVVAHQEDAAVPAFLAVALGRRRRGPLDVELHIPEPALGMDPARPRHDFHVSVMYGPFGRAAVVVAGPLRQVGAIEEHDGVARGRNGRLGRCRRHHRRPGSVHRIRRPPSLRAQCRSHQHQGST